MDKDASRMETEIKVEFESERYISILDKRRIDRKEEDEADIEKRPCEKPDEATVASRIENILDKLKQKFKEEKLARSQATKVSRTYQLFCNGVDGFLRYHENSGGIVRYTEPDVEVLEEEPDKMEKNVKVPVEESSQTSQVHEPKLNDDFSHKDTSYDLFPTQNSVLLGKSEINDCHEVSPILGPSLSGKPQISKQLTTTKEDECGFVINSSINILRIGGCVMKQKSFPTSHLDQCIFASHPIFVLKKGSSLYGTMEYETKIFIEVCDIHLSKRPDLKRVTSFIIHNRPPYTANTLATPFEQSLPYSRGKEMFGFKHSILSDCANTNKYSLGRSRRSIRHTGEHKYCEHNNVKIIQKSRTSIYQKDEDTRTETDCPQLITNYPAKSEDINEALPSNKIILPINTSDDNMLPTESSDRKQDTVPSVKIEKINDEDDDDDSPFGILSVYCRSRIHSVITNDCGD